MPPELDNDVRVENRLYPLPSRFAERRTAAVGLGYAQRPASAQGFRAAIGFSEPVSATTRSVSTAQVRHRGRLSFVEEPARAELSQAEWNFRRPGPQRWYRPWCLAIWARLLWRRSRTWPHCPIRKISLTRGASYKPRLCRGVLTFACQKNDESGLRLAFSTSSRRRSISACGHDTCPHSQRRMPSGLLRWPSPEGLLRPVVVSCAV